MRTPRIFTTEMRLVYDLGRYVLFMRSMFSKPERFSVYVRRTLDEMNSIGVGSLPIVAIISFFIGAVTTVQTAYQLVSALIQPSVIGTVVSDSTFLELAPTITSLVLAGKVGSHIASELGTMRVSEQVDALEVMGINAAGYLALPKIVAGLIMIPVLIIMANFLSITGGIIAGAYSGILTPTEFIIGARDTFEFYTVFISMVKAFVFAFLITSISCFEGFYTQGGALEVGEASTRAVVRSCVMILIFDFLIAKVLL
jgi:phospholipid/cholesterol/gamma-HCH transport system permease protein